MPLPASLDSLSELMAWAADIAAALARSICRSPAACTTADLDAGVRLYSVLARVLGISAWHAAEMEPFFKASRVAWLQSTRERQRQRRELFTQHGWVALNRQVVLAQASYFGDVPILALDSFDNGEAVVHVATPVAGVLSSNNGSGSSSSSSGGDAAGHASSGQLPGDSIEVFGGMAVLRSAGVPCTGTDVGYLRGGMPAQLLSRLLHGWRVIGLQVTAEADARTPRLWRCHLRAQALLSCCALEGGVCAHAGG